MKIFGKIVLWFLVVLILAVILGLGYLGYIPGVSQVLGADKPQNLGVTYTPNDFASARAKSQLVYEALPPNTPDSMSLQRSGSRAVTTTLNSAEMTAFMNDRPWKYWPIRSVQLRINDDGTAELSGILIKDRLQGYAAGIGAPTEIANIVANFLPAAPTFYVKAKTSLVNNKVGDFDIQSVKLGRMPIPVDTLLSFKSSKMVDSAFASDGISQLSQYSGKRAAIIDFINSRLSQITGFFAKSASFSAGKLNFDGTLSEKELTVR